MYEFCYRTVIRDEAGVYTNLWFSNEPCGNYVIGSIGPPQSLTPKSGQTLWVDKYPDPYKLYKLEQVEHMCGDDPTFDDRRKYYHNS